MAINEAARRGAIANWLNLDGSIYIRYAAPPYSASTVMASVYGKWVKTPVLFFVIMIWHIFVEIRTITK